MADRGKTKISTKCAKNSRTDDTKMKKINEDYPVFGHKIEENSYEEKSRDLTLVHTEEKWNGTLDGSEEKEDLEDWNEENLFLKVLDEAEDIEEEKLPIRRYRKKTMKRRRRMKMTEENHAEVKCSTNWRQKWSYHTNVEAKLTNQMNERKNSTSEGKQTNESVKNIEKYLTAEREITDFNTEKYAAEFNLTEKLKFRMPYWAEHGDLTSKQFVNTNVPWNWELSAADDAKKFTSQESFPSDSKILNLITDENPCKYKYVGISRDQLERKTDPQTGMLMEKPLILPRPCKPATSLIVKTNGADGMFKIQQILDRVGASGNVYYDRGHNQNELELVFNHRRHYLCTFRVANELISPNDSMYLFKDWNIIQAAVMVVGLPGEADEDGNISDAYSFEYNMSYPVQEIITGVMAAFWDEYQRTDIEHQTYISTRQLEGARAASRSMTKPKPAEYRLERVVPRHGQDAWLQRWDAEDKLHLKKKDERKAKTMPAGSNREKFTNAFIRLQDLEEDARQARRRRAIEEAEELQRREDEIRRRRHGTPFERMLRDLRAANRRIENDEGFGSGRTSRIGVSKNEDKLIKIENKLKENDNEEIMEDEAEERAEDSNVNATNRRTDPREVPTVSSINLQMMFGEEPTRRPVDRDAQIQQITEEMRRQIEAAAANQVEAERTPLNLNGTDLSEREQTEGDNSNSTIRQASVENSNPGKELYITEVDNYEKIELPRMNNSDKEFARGQENTWNVCLCGSDLQNELCACPSTRPAEEPEEFFIENEENLPVITPEDSISHVCGPTKIQPEEDEESSNEEATRVSIKFLDKSSEKIDPRNYDKMRRFATSARLQNISSEGNTIGIFNDTIPEEVTSEVGPTPRTSEAQKKKGLKTAKSMIGLDPKSKTAARKNLKTSEIKKSLPRPKISNTSTPQMKAPPPPTHHDSTIEPEVTLKAKEKQKKTMKKTETPKNTEKKMARSKSRRRLSKASEISTASSVISEVRGIEGGTEESPRASRFANRQKRMQENEKRKRGRDADEGKAVTEADTKKNASVTQKKTPPSMKNTTEDTSRYIHSLKINKNKKLTSDQRVLQPLLNDLKQKILQKRMIKTGKITEDELIKEAIKICFRLEEEKIEFFNATEDKMKILYIFTPKGSIELKINKNQKFTLKVIFSLLLSAVKNHKYSPPDENILEKGTYTIQSVRPDVFPIIKKQGRELPVRYYSRKMIFNISDYISKHTAYFQPLNITLGAYYLEDYATNLCGYADSYSYKVGEMLKTEDIQEEDDLYLAGRPDWAEMMKEMNLNKLPINRNEHFIMKKQKKKCKDLGEFLLKNKYKIAKNYSLKEQMEKIEAEEKFEGAKKKLKKDTEDDESKEVNRHTSHHSQGTNANANSQIRQFEILQNTRNVSQNISENDDRSREEERTEETNEESDETPFHHWMDGTPIYLQRNPVPDEKFEEAEAEEIEYKRRQSARDTLKTITVAYANMPHDKMNSRRNMFTEVTQIHPEVDVWMMCEMYWNPSRSHSEAPPGYFIHTHHKLKKKNTAIMIKNELKSICKLRKSEQTETSVKLEGDVNIGLTVFYRSPSKDKAPAFKYLKLPGNESKEINFMRWMDRRISAIMTSERNKSKEIICGDFNIDIHNFRRRSNADEITKIGREIWQEAFESNWLNFLRKKRTYVSRQNVENSIDVFATNRRDLILKIEESPMDDNASISDHVIWISKLNAVKRVPIGKPMVVRRKLKSDTKQEDEIRKEIGRGLTEKLVTAYENDNNPESVIQKFSEACIELIPEKIVKPRTETKVMNFDEELRDLKVERQFYISRNNIQGLGGYYSSRHRRLRDLNKKINRRRQKLRKIIWEAKLGRVNLVRDIWKLLKQFKNEKRSFPSWLTANGTAKFFKTLSWTYTPLKLPMIKRGNLTAENRTMTPSENPEGKFEFTRLEFNSEFYKKNLKALICDGKGSQHACTKDGITMSMIKSLTAEGWKILSEVVDEIIRTGRYIPMFRKQRCSPVPKTEIIQIFKHVRPVTIGTAMITAVEKVLAKQYYMAAEEKRWFHPQQYGFRSSYSIGLLHSDLKKIIARREHEVFALVQTDQSNAFGSPDVEAILKELDDKITDGAHDLLKCFLIQSEAVVNLEDAQSEEFKTSPRGFTQGSCLSPIAFCSLMTNSHYEVNSESVTFADDANYLPDAPEELIAERITNTIKEFQKFCKKLNIQMNVSKTFYMTSSGKDYNIIVDGIKIEHKKVCNLLGIELDNKFGISRQIEEIIKKCKPLKYLLRTFCKMYKTENAQTVFANAYVIGSFNHGSQYLPEWTLDQYEKLQHNINKALNYRTSRILQYKALSNDFEDERERRTTTRIIRNLRNLQVKYPWIQEITVPQWLLLKRHKMTSVQNIHRLNWMTRMIKLLRTARPEVEYRDMMNYLTESARRIRRNIREGMRFPYFQTMLHNDMRHSRNIIKDTTPTIWLREFGQLPQEMRRICMTDECASEHIATFYKERCQHAENTDVICEGCDQSQSNYRLGRVKYSFRELNEIAEERSNWLRQSIMIWNGSEWINAYENEEGVHDADDVICVIWNDPHSRMQTLRQLGLTRNTELENLVNRIHGTH